MKIVAVVNQKGGVGKTTTVMGLASFAAQHHNVLVVDVDPQQSVTQWAQAAEDIDETPDLGFDVATEADPEVLSEIRRLEYDLVFVDTPGSLENEDVLKIVIENSDFVVLPSETSALSIMPLVRTFSTLIEPTGTGHLVVLTRVDARSRTDLDDTRELMSDAGLKVAKTPIRRYIAHERAPISGLVPSNYSGYRNDMKSADDYRLLTGELLSSLGMKGE